MTCGNRRLLLIGWLQNYRDAALTYEQLVKFHDDEPRYKVYYAQSLYKAGLYAEVRANCGVRGELCENETRFFDCCRHICWPCVERGSSNSC